MHRREALALLAATTVPLAGCSSGDGDETNETPSPNGTPPDNSTDDPVDDPSDDGNSSDGDDDPTEEELAQEDVDAAQSALQSAVDELSEQGAAYSGLGEDDDVPVTAAVSGLSAGPVRDELSSVQSAIDDAREHDTTGDQADTLDALETTKDWIHAVLDAYQPVRDLFLEANYALQDHIAEDASADLQAVRREADQAQSSVDDATDPYATPEAGGIDAITTDGVEAQVDRLEAELESGRSVGDAIEDTLEADELWEQGATHIGADEYSEASEDFEAAKSAYGSIPASELSESYSAASDYFGCYTSNMRSACEDGVTAAAYYSSGDDTQGRGFYEGAQSHRSDAQNCSMDWSG